MDNEYDKIRSGRVNLAIFNGIKVEAYGEKMPLNQLANFQVVDARQVLIKPYDKELCKSLMGELNDAKIGGNIQLNVDHVKIIFPPVTEENRKQNVKKAKEILEQTKVKIRNVRQDVQNKFKKNKDISDDLIKFFEDELNKITKKTNQNIENTYVIKEKELLSI
jgi:ribosome recycling factor